MFGRGKVAGQWAMRRIEKIPFIVCILTEMKFPAVKIEVNRKMQYKNKNFHMKNVSSFPVD